MLEMKLDIKYVLIVLILTILIILLFKIFYPQISNKLVAENFDNTPTTTPFTTIPYNTQYLKNIQNQFDSGYSMLNNNRFTIMDNQLRLDSLNSRINKLLNNIKKINNASNNKNKQQQNNLTFY